MLSRFAFPAIFNLEDPVISLLALRYLSLLSDLDCREFVPVTLGGLSWLPLPRGC